MTLPPPNAIIEPPFPPRCGLASFTDEELQRLPDLPSDDGEPLETPWHVFAMNQLREVATYHYRERNDFFTGGNMFVYYHVERQRHRDFRGPDFFFVWGVDRHRPRDYYAIWLENNRYPNVVLELLSPSTAQIDRVEKRALYQDTWHLPEYFLCEPQVESLEGLRLNEQQVYESIPTNERGWLWSEQLQLWLGPWTGPYLQQTATWPRFYDALGRLVPRFDEAARQHADQEKQRADAAQQHAEQEKQRADAAQQHAAQEKQRAEAEHQRAEQEIQRAEQEKQRADAAEAETARLRRQLEEMRQQFPKSPETPRP
ncbi:MAG: Uma2 family endonuclease [Gemmataceae bacterium]